jgi:hypothetical protein
MLLWSIPLGSWDVSTIMASLSANNKLGHPVTYTVEGGTQGLAARVFIFTPSPVARGCGGPSERGHAGGKQQQAHHDRHEGPHR